MILPEALERIRLDAKALARKGNFTTSFERNKLLTLESKTCDCTLGEALGYRFAGVCAYRLEQYEESEELLRKALAKAEEKGLHQQRLYIANHLGATVRRLGRLDEAYEIFRLALSRICLPDDLEAKARLLGSFGAFLDEIGNERGADDCYARYEELTELLVSSGNGDDKPRLANARALAARAALRRGDLEVAREKHEQEYALANESGDRLRQRNALFHRAKVSLELGLRARRDGEDPAVFFKQAEEGLARAYEEFETAGHQSRMADVLHHQAWLHEAQGRWLRAYGAWRDAQAKSKECKHLYRQARSSLALARMSQEFALHGESLYWFREAARIHHDLYVPLAKSLHIERMAQTRVLELRDVAAKLLDELGRVEREHSDWELVREQVESMCGVPMNASLPMAPEPVHDWQKRIRLESRERSEKLLSKERFGRLSKQSQDDLIMSDMLYHGIIDDLPRSALLVAIVVERELRERLFVPLHEAFWARSSPEPKAEKAMKRHSLAAYLCAKEASYVPLGNALSMVKEICDDSTHSEILAFARAVTAHCREELKAIEPLGKGAPVLGKAEPVQLREIRNDAAHGNAKAAALDRISVDALRRQLFLEPPMILASIIDVGVR